MSDIRAFITSTAASGCDGCPGSIRRTVTLREVPDEELDRIAALGFDWVWLLSVWRTRRAALSRAARPGLAERISRDAARPDRGRHLPIGLRDIRLQPVSKALGGGAALADIRRRLAKRGL